MRLFAAIPVEGAAADALDRVAEGLLFGRPVPEDQWHVTLLFADRVAEDVAEEFALNLRGLAMDRFAWRVRGFGSFGGDAPRQVHAVIDPTEALTELERRVRREARDAGLVAAHRRFVPHVTLARLRGAPLDRAAADWLAEHATTALGPFVAERVVLYESELTPEGPRHIPLAGVALG